MSSLSAAENSLIALSWALALFACLPATISSSASRSSMPGAVSRSTQHGSGGTSAGGDDAPLDAGAEPSEGDVSGEPQSPPVTAAEMRRCVSAGVLACDAQTDPGPEPGADPLVSLHCASRVSRKPLLMWPQISEAAEADTKAARHQDKETKQR